MLTTAPESRERLNEPSGSRSANSPTPDATTAPIDGDHGCPPPGHRVRTAPLLARIRTIKPEAFVSESLAAVTLTAERTFFGLLTQADDQGRHRDHAAITAGQLWVLRPEHTPADVEKDLAQLADAGLICRYTGPDDKRYLHVVTWHQHQKINRPSKSRLPACPHHDAVGGTARAGLTEAAPLPHGTVREGSRQRQETAVNIGDVSEIAGEDGFTEPSVTAHDRLTEPSVSPQGTDLGPRIMDLGSTPSGGASAPRPTPSRPSTSSPSTPPLAHTVRPRTSWAISLARCASCSTRASTPHTSGPASNGTVPRVCTPAPCRASCTRS